MKHKIITALLLTTLFQTGWIAAADEAPKNPAGHIADTESTDAPKKGDEETVVTADDPTEKEEDKSSDTKVKDSKEKESQENDTKEKDTKKLIGKNKKEAKEKKEKVEPEKIFEIDASPLQQIDFTVKGVSLGQSFTEAAGHLGKPVSEKSGAVRSEYGWKDLSVRFVSELAAKYDDKMKAGADALYLSGKSVKTARGIAVGSRRENILRRYGRPARVLWDGTKGCFYMIYLKGNQMLLFTVEKGTVKDIRITYKDDRFMEEMAKDTKAADFRIAGYRLRDTFSEHSWETWLRKATNPEEEIIYYLGYGINTNVKTHRINAMFLTDSAMPTTRGIAVGDLVSTLETVYGVPDKVEVNRMSGDPEPAYIYFSADEEDVLIFYINGHNRTVRSVVVMPNPIGPRADRNKPGDKAPAPVAK